MSKKGIVIAAMQKYEHLLISNLCDLRKKLGCKLPIEIWQIDQEVSDHVQLHLESIQMQWNIILKNIKDYTNNPEHWRGYQIKAFILKYSSFDEVILADCDTIFLVNPEIIFKDPNYISTGTYFFKDYLAHTPKNDEELSDRKTFIKTLMPDPPQYLPKELNYLYDMPIENVQSMWYYQDSGLVYIDKKMHPDIIQTIYELNDNHKETYKYVHGDKETFWMACLMNNKPFYMNPTPGVNLMPYIEKPRMRNKVIDNTEQIFPAFTHLYLHNSVLSKSKVIEPLLIPFFAQKGYPDYEVLSEEHILKNFKGSPQYKTLPAKIGIPVYENMT